MKALANLWKMLLHPRRTSREVLEEKTISLSLSVVLGFAIILSLLFFISHLAGDYPPPPKDLETWIATWGEFAMLPFVKIPPENYRLAQAIFITPMVLAIWILMAGSARLLSLLFGGKVTFEQYLNLFGFSFFSFWIIGQFLDMLYSNLLGDFILPALRLEYGPVIKSICATFPSVMWTTALTFGGVYNAIVTHESERFSLIKASFVGIATFFWPIVLISSLVR